MIEGKTRTGFKFKIDERIKNDWRVVSAIAMVEGTNTADQIKGIAELVKLVIGKDEQKLADHIAKKNDGFVPMQAVTDELTDILSASEETKN